MKTKEIVNISKKIMELLKKKTKFTNKFLRLFKKTNATKSYNKLKTIYKNKSTFSKNDIELILKLTDKLLKSKRLQRKKSKKNINIYIKK